MEIIRYKGFLANAYFIKDGETVYAVDTTDTAGRDFFLENCERAGITPEQISLIIITHGHVDHFANLPVMKELTKAPVLCHKRAERFLVNGLPPEVVARTPIGEMSLQIMATMKEKPGGAPPRVIPDILIEGEYDLSPWGIPGRIIETCGHSDNDISVILPNKEAIIGDIFAAPGVEKDGVMTYFTYPGGNFTEAEASIEKLLQEDTEKFWLGHGDPCDRAYLAKALQEEKALDRQ